MYTAAHYEIIQSVLGPNQFFRNLILNVSRSERMKSRAQPAVINDFLKQVLETQKYNAYVL
jgi:hypothetical protein